jgi:hypothetical protein
LTLDPLSANASPLEFAEIMFAVNPTDTFTLGLSFVLNGAP